jgi:hypothetical protein
MGACYLARYLLWKFMHCLEGSPTFMSLASRSAPVPLSPLAPYPCEARVRARGERGTRTERGESEERARSASGRRQLGGHGAGREAQRKRARAQEGAQQEGASTGGREHRRRKLRRVSVSELPKEPANNRQSLRVKPRKSRNSFSFASPFADYCNSFYDKCVDQPANDLQTSRKRKFRFAKCGKYLNHVAGFKRFKPNS